MNQHNVFALDTQAGATAPKTLNDTGANTKIRGFHSAARLPDVVAGASTSAMRWVAKRVGISLATNGTVQGALQVNLRDSGTTGAGNILKPWQIGIGLVTALSGVNCVNIDEDNLGIPGLANSAINLEFAGAPAAATTSSVFLQAFAEVGD